MTASQEGSERAADRVVVRASGLSKVYRLYDKPIHRFVDLVLPGRGRYQEFWALQDVDLELHGQSTIGIIGENGAGKSTLLKLLSGITHPTRGEVEVNGRLTSLIELGAGFHPDFSGRENIGLSCSILGLGDDEIREREQRIVEFSELGAFIDRPVKTYSSGMHVRLGFSVATCVEPDILLIDEALSVGDEYFKGKCMNRLNEFREAGGTVVFVSHDMSAVKTLCQYVIYLDNGRIAEQGPPEKVADEYLRRAHARGKKNLDAAHQDSAAYPRWGSGEMLVEGVELVGESGEPTVAFETGEPFTARLRWKAYATVADPVFGLGLYRADGTYINGSNHLWQDEPLVIGEVRAGEEGVVEMSLGPLPLLPGRYYVTAFLYDHSRPSPTPVDHREHALAFQVLDRNLHQHGLMHLPTRWSLSRNGRADGGGE